MAGVKECSTGPLDGFLAYLYNNSTQLKIMVTTSSSPMAIANASSNNAGVLVISTNPSIPTTAYYTVGSSGNNRYIAITACSSDTVLRDGIAACVILVSACSSEVMFVTTCTTQSLTSGSKANIGTFSITITQPT